MPKDSQRVDGVAVTVAVGVTGPLKTSGSGRQATDIAKALKGVDRVDIFIAVHVAQDQASLSGRRSRRRDRADGAIEAWTADESNRKGKKWK